MLLARPQPLALPPAATIFKLTESIAEINSG
jgi:hypothetical protein